MVVVAVPEAWYDQILSATTSVSGWRWHVQVVNDPEAALAQGEAQIALVPGGDGFHAVSRAVALTVPFTSSWEDVPLADALSIREEGAPSVVVLPWDRMTPERKALTVDGYHPSDATYPLREEWSLSAPPPWNTAAEALAAAILRSAEGGVVHLAAVGDIMLDRTLGVAIAGGDIAYPFTAVAGALQKADLTVGNLECALGSGGEPAAKSYTFRAPPEAALSLAAAGFDLFSLANNHALDFGPDLLVDGIERLQTAGVAVAGAGIDQRAAHSPVYFERNGLKLAFLSYVNVPVEGRAPYFDTQDWTATESSPGLAWAVPEQISGDVARAKQQADLVIVLLHSGYEYVPAPSPPQTEAARAAIDAGAALVLGHHAHILQGVEFRGGGIIAYGLGNFAFTIDGPPETAILNIWLDSRGVRELSFLPAMVQPSGQPRLATTGEASAILQRIHALTTLPASP
jgi:poly-gamma-glutamate synthesis protein (capsule biosynthesis protein)